MMYCCRYNHNNYRRPTVVVVVVPVLFLLLLLSVFVHFPSSSQTKIHGILAFTTIPMKVSSLSSSRNIINQQQPNKKNSPLCLFSDHHNTKKKNNIHHDYQKTKKNKYQKNQFFELLLSSRESTTNVIRSTTTKTTTRRSSSPLFSTVATTGLDESFTSNTSQPQTTNSNDELSKFMSTVTKIGMMMYILMMCIALPLTLYPQKFIHALGITSTVQKEKWALSTGRFCARWLLRLIPFCSVECIVDNKNNTSNNSKQTPPPPPTIWACNHTSMLDVFILLAADRKLRGKNKRPIKIVYWKSLESNPVTKLLFTMSGFIPVEMVANKPGEDNQYDKSSFKKLLKSCKEAFVNGFDIAILPEGQLNPNPEVGLLPVFTGAYTLAKMSQRPIQMIALYNIHNLWHPIKGMIASTRIVKLRNYNLSNQIYKSPQEFKIIFENVVGYFGKTGTDIDHVQDWFNGNINVIDSTKDNNNQNRIPDEKETTVAIINGINGDSNESRESSGL